MSRPPRPANVPVAYQHGVPYPTSAQPQPSYQQAPIQYLPQSNQPPYPQPGQPVQPVQPIQAAHAHARPPNGGPPVRPPHMTNPQAAQYAGADGRYQPVDPTPRLAQSQVYVFPAAPTQPTSAIPAHPSPVVSHVAQPAQAQAYAQPQQAQPQAWYQQSVQQQIQRQHLHEREQRQQAIQQQQFQLQYQQYQMAHQQQQQHQQAHRPPAPVAQARPPNVAYQKFGGPQPPPQIITPSLNTNVSQLPLETRQHQPQYGYNGPTLRNHAATQQATATPPGPSTNPQPLPNVQNHQSTPAPQSEGGSRPATAASAAQSQSAVPAVPQGVLNQQTSTQAAVAPDGMTVPPANAALSLPQPPVPHNTMYPTPNSGAGPSGFGGPGMGPAAVYPSGLLVQPPFTASPTIITGPPSMGLTGPNVANFVLEEWLDSQGRCDHPLVRPNAGMTAMNAFLDMVQSLAGAPYGEWEELLEDEFCQDARCRLAFASKRNGVQTFDFAAAMLPRFFSSFSPRLQSLSMRPGPAYETPLWSTPNSPAEDDTQPPNAYGRHGIQIDLDTNRWFWEYAPVTEIIVWTCNITALWVPDLVLGRLTMELLEITVDDVSQFGGAEGAFPLGMPNATLVVLEYIMGMENMAEVMEITQAKRVGPAVALATLTKGYEEPNTANHDRSIEQQDNNMGQEDVPPQQSTNEA